MFEKVQEINEVMDKLKGKKERIVGMEVEIKEQGEQVRRGF